MAFFRGAWHIIVAIKDLLVLALLLLFFAGLYALLSMRGTAPAIGEGALVVRLDGVVVEQPSQVDPFAAVSGQDTFREYRLRDVVRAIETAATDSNVKAVVLDLDSFMGGGQVALSRIGAAIGKVKAAKKPVLAYASFYTDDGYQLAAQASEIWMNPIGIVGIAGPGGSRLYYKGLIDKLGLTTHVYRVGTYKSFVEPYTRTESSPEAKEADKALAGALWQNWLDEVKKARPQAALDGYVADPVAIARNHGGNGAAAALAARLIDKEGDVIAFGNRVAALVGDPEKDRPGDYNAIDLDSYAKAHPATAKPGKVGVVTVAGDIIDGEAGPGLAAGDSVASLIEDALASGEIKALVLRVDSPGGSVLASERIRQALMSARARNIPVVASMGNVAASGGYWVSTAANRIYAEPSTITGSIGVFGIMPSFENTLAKIGVTTDGIKTTPLSGEPDLAGGVSPAFNSIAQASVQDVYRRFLALVGKARGMDVQAVDKIGQGRVWDGGTARQLNLVDAFGGLDDAVAEAARLAKLTGSDARARYVDPPLDPFAQLIGNLTGTDADRATGADWLGHNAMLQRLRAQQIIADLRQIGTGAGIRADCLACRDYGAVRAMAPAVRGDRGWLNWLGTAVRLNESGVRPN